MSRQTDEIKGRTKESIGALTDDEDLKREGRTDQAAAEAKGKLQEGEDWAEDKIDKLKDKLNRKDA